MKEKWIKEAEERVYHYLHLGDGGFDENMHAHFECCDYDEQTITIGFDTLKWQINERGAIHGGAIAGMFDTAFGIVANFVVGVNEATTTDMNISFLRGFEYGQHCNVKVYIVKAGRSLIRLRAEMICVETGKILATGSGSWMPL